MYDKQQNKSWSKNFVQRENVIINQSIEDTYNSRQTQNQKNDDKILNTANETDDEIINKAKFEMFEEMIEKLAERIDLIDDELMQQKKYVGNLGVVVMKHDGIMEYQNEQLEIKMNANNNFMEENFLSINNK